MAGLDRRLLHHSSGAAADAFSDARRIFSWALPLGLASGAVALTFSIPRIMLGVLDSSEAVAQYSVAASIFAVASLLTAAIGQVGIPKLARCARAGDHLQFTSTLITMIRAGVAAGVSVGVIATLLGPVVFPLAFGEEYRSSRVIFAVLSLALTIGCMGTFLQDALTSLSMRREQVIAFGAGTVTPAYRPHGCLRCAANRPCSHNVFSPVAPG